MDEMVYNAMLDDLDHREQYPDMYDDKGNFIRPEKEKEKKKKKRKLRRES